MTKLPPSPARELKAYVLSTEILRHRTVKPIAAALLAAGAHDPKLLAEASRARATTLKEMKLPGLSPVFSKVVATAVDGLILSEMLGMSNLTRRERESFIGELLRLIEEEEARS